LKIENYRYIKSFQLPNGWREEKPVTGIATSIVRSFSPPGNTAVKLEFFYRGLPLDEKSSKSFRGALKLAPRLMFDNSSTNKLESSDARLICDLEGVLGNVGNNQISNTETGFSGPSFSLDRLDALIWNNRPLLAARGWFIDPESAERRSAFCGFFIDANPNEKNCSVEEIYLEAEAEAEDLYLQYMPELEKCLHSIEWSTVRSGSDRE